jgi:hypothetical protein
MTVHYQAKEPTNLSIFWWEEKGPNGVIPGAASDVDAM